MNIKRILLVILLFFLINLLVPKTSHAVSFQEMLTSENSVITKIQEGFEYFFAFKVENKIAVLEKHAEKRLVMAQGYAEEGNSKRVQSLMQNYLQIKERQNNLMGEVNNGEVLGAVENKTIEQQKTMEEIKAKVGEEGKQDVIQAQEKVVNQVSQRIVEENGSEEQVEFLNKVVHVWAPGTEPKAGEEGLAGEAGVVYEGGGKLIFAPGTGPGNGGIVIEGGELRFAPGTSAGSENATSDIKTVEVKTGGGPESVVENPNPGNASGGEAANPGTDDTRTWIDP